MKLSDEKIIRASERALKRTEAYQENRLLGDEKNYQIFYLLKKGKNAAPNSVIAFADKEEQVISFHPFREDEPIWNWDFNFDNDLFKYLQEGYELVDMTSESHYGVWWTIEEWHDGEISYPKGMQKYLSYCKQNGITKEKLKYSGMDAMDLYEPKTERTDRKKEMER